MNDVFETNATRQLAICVIKQAFDDARGRKIRCKDLSEPLKVQALSFLLGSTPAWRQSLEDWCAIAGFDIQRVVRAAKKQFCKEEA